MLFAIIFITALVALFVQVYIAMIFHNIAMEKGFPSWVSFWQCFLLGITGYLMVIALPDKNARPVAPTDLPHK